MFAVLVLVHDAFLKDASHELSKLFQHIELINAVLPTKLEQKRNVVIAGEFTYKGRVRAQGS